MVVRSQASVFAEGVVNTYLSSAQEALKEQYRNFAAQSVAPVAASLESHAKDLKEVLQEIAQKGYLGINVPREYGGQSLGLLPLVLFVEAVSCFEPGLGLTLSNHAAVIELLKRFGTGSQKSRYLPALARGEGFGTLAFSEENAGVDFSAVASRIEKSGNKITCTGKKTLVVSGDFATLVVVLARLGDKDGDLGLYLSEVQDSKACRVQARRAISGLSSAHINDMEFEDFPIEEGGQLIGASAGQMALYALDVAKTVLAGAAVGLSEAAIASAVDHARKRTQFGVNIGQFQGIQWKLADMEVAATGAKLQTYRAAWSHEGDLSNFARHAAMCKLVATNAARFISSESASVLATCALDSNHPLTRFLRDARALEICLGTAEFQKMLLVSELAI